MLHLQKALHPTVFLLRPTWGNDVEVPPDYVWREGAAPKVLLLGEPKQRLLSAQDRTLLHNFFLVECEVYASAFNKFSQGIISTSLLRRVSLLPEQASGVNSRARHRTGICVL